MGFQAKDVQLSYNFAKVVPADDPDMIHFQNFRKLFGEDDNIIGLGIKDSTVFQLENFRRYQYLSAELNRLNGIENVLSLSNLQRLAKDTDSKKFVLEPIFQSLPNQQNELDSLFKKAMDQKFYSGQLINAENGALMLIMTVNKDVMNSERRTVLVSDIQMAADSFSQVTGIDTHLAGVPFVRTIVTAKIKKEMQMFLVLSLLVTALIMWFFFRSWDAVLFPMIIIAVIVVWSMGTLSLFDYHITILTGLIPPIIVVIGIPNSIYLLNKYHQEISLHGNKMLALSRVIRKIGLATLITNTTTAIGFAVLAFTDIAILNQFGLVTAINIMATFLVSLILIPAVFSYLPAPKGKQLKHLKFKSLDRVLNSLDILVHRHKYRVFFFTGIIVVISIFGLFKIHSVSYLVDDIPEKSKIKQDLAFFERNFSGIMPLEVVVDTRKPRGVMRLQNLQKVDQFEEFMESQSYIGQPISLVSFVKAARQAFYNNNPTYYSLPNNQDRTFILRYFQGQSDATGLLNSFVDSTGQIMRLSIKMADIGSNKMDSLLEGIIKPKISELFGETEMEVAVTGTTPLFVKGNRFLIENLRLSLLLAFAIISMIMAMLYGNLRMILISLIPNMIPLLISGALMGYFGVPLKPSTAIIFSIAFGISVDYSIHFLAKYRQEMYANNHFVPLAVSKSIRETGLSMIYTSIVLFAGFIIFAWSEFGGTIALGVMTSTTLLIAMLTNLILLPALLLAFDNGKRNKTFQPLIEHYDEFYQEDEDEEIDIELIRLRTSENGEDINNVETQYNNLTK
jgi:predicted RND superfamily exporter protein